MGCMEFEGKKDNLGEREREYNDKRLRKYLCGHSIENRSKEEIL